MSNSGNQKLDFFKGRNIRFVGEQIGIAECEFKSEIVKLFQSCKGVLRAYLAQVAYDGIKDFNVALCISLERSEDQKLACDIAEVFRRMFGINEHLDIIFINCDQEVDIRKVCCPFFTVSPLSQPDFYLSSSEGYNLEKFRACYKEKRLIGSHPDGYMLCEIVPPIIGQKYGLGGQDIHKVIIASRHQGYSIFSISEWPVYVHVARLVDDAVSDKCSLTDTDIESIGWAEIYESPNA